MGQYWNKDVMQWLSSDWEVALVRAAMGVEAGGYLEHPETEKAKITTVVDAAIANGIYVIIDWHERMRTSTWNSPRLSSVRWLRSTERIPMCCSRPSMSPVART